jgi:diguanylate cyclase (GGDEF)-like protein
MERARLTCRPFALILLDLDRFKQLNDTQGHAAGDAALQAVAQTLVGMIRAEDILARIGGEEFAIGLPDPLSTEATEVAERLRRSVSRLAPAAPDGTVMHLTASFGVAGMAGSDRRIDDVLRRADAAVYAAKGNGRNRVELAAGVTELGTR